MGVNLETGEVAADGSCGHEAIIEALEDQIAGLQRDIRGWATRYANLARDKEQEARVHPAWDEVKGLFDYWKQECHHALSRFNADRFWLALPYYEKDGPQMMRRAIRGAAFDPFVTTRRSGREKRHNGWDLIFRDRAHFDDMAERAPLAIEPSALKTLAEQILESMPEDDRPTTDRIHEAVGRAEAYLRAEAVKAERAR